MKNWLFCDYESGEDFIVEAPTEEKAVAIAKEYFADPCGNPDEISDYEAEMMGLDTYQEETMTIHDFISRLKEVERDLGKDTRVIKIDGFQVDEEMKFTPYLKGEYSPIYGTIEKNIIIF